MAERRQTDRMGRSVDARVAARAAETWGVLSLEELLGCGLTKRQVLGRARRGILHRLHEGVYAVGHPNVGREGTFLAAVKACGPKAALSLFSAAELQEFLDPEDRLPHVTVVGPGTRARPGIKVHRSALLEPEDLTRVKGIPVTTPARTIVDLAALLNDSGLRRLVRRAQGEKRVSIPQLAEALERLGPRRGAARLRRTLATGPAPTKSELENIVLDLILRGGLAHPDVNVPLLISGRRVVPDFRWPEQRLVVEADGAAWHDNPVARTDDAERQALLEAHGERVLRVTWAQSVTQPSQTLTRIAAAGAPRPRCGRG
jgi:predicted transcriptional regulator of viral defense system